MQKFRKTSWRKQTICLRIYAIMSCSLVLASCAKQQCETAEPVCLENIDRLGAMQAGEEVLAKMHFIIDKADPEAGLIRTLPLPAAQFFEFWRSDNIAPKSAVEANLHSIRKTVELKISKQSADSTKEKPQKLCIACDVKVERLALPEHEVSSSARAYEMFSQSSRSMQILKLHAEQKKGMAWVDLGQDQQLAAEILRRIENKLTAENAGNAEEPIE